MPLIPALGRQRQADFWVRGQPGLQSEFQDSQSYTEKPCLEKKKKQQQQKKTLNGELLSDRLQKVCYTLIEAIVVTVQNNIWNPM
jgi:hypothetical protein